MRPPRSLALALPLALAALAAAPAPARAFCGFYVAGADAKLFNNATMVVMMREGTRTVLSMQNNYQGPPENFAMVVPVPVVLQKENVKTLSDDIFDRVDKLAAPRLVEYWEQDPCMMREREGMAETAADAPGGAGPLRMSGADKGVKIEAQFKVGEYDILILSAQDALGLDSWLRENKYTIPDGAEPILRPYVQGGMKFFVAKVDTAKVKFDKGMAKLSPLRFHYDTDTFNLPVRLGLLNSAGTQDLIVHVLSRGQRYEVANYKNVTIPTNLDVSDAVRTQFGAFYAALFDRTLEENPGAVITEYAWGASSCDPCPTSPLAPEDFATLGGDVLSTPVSEEDSWKPERQFVLTRLHARYRKDTLGEDLVFRTAKPIVGGREFLGQDGKLETGGREDSLNNFQGRYAIRHAWTGPMNCANPKRGVWGGPPDGRAHASAQVAQDLAFAPRGAVQLASFVRHDVPEINLKLPSAPIPRAGELPKSAQAPTGTSGCGSCATGGGAEDGTLAAGALALALAARRRRARRTP